MISTALKMNKQKGFATLAVTLTLLLVLTLTSLFTASTLITEQQITSNSYRSHQAFSVAQAGIGYGINYLNENRATVTNGQIITGTMANGSSYSVQFNFVGATNEVVSITSTGNSGDNTGTKVLKQIVKYQPLIITSPTTPLTARGNGRLAGSGNVINLENSNTIRLGGGTMNIQGGNASTTIAGGGGSDSGSINSDVDVSNAAIAAMNNATFEEAGLGATLSELMNYATVSYTYAGDHNYSAELNGQKGKIILINNTSGLARINSGAVVGTAAEPVTILVNGDLKLDGSATIHGNVIVMNGTMTMNGNSTINGLLYSQGDLTMGNGSMEVNGAIITAGDFDISGSATITFDSTVLNSMLTNSGTYAKVSGSWQDLNN